MTYMLKETWTGVMDDLYTEIYPGLIDADYAKLLKDFQLMVEAKVLVPVGD